MNNSRSRRRLLNTSALVAVAISLAAAGAAAAQDRTYHIPSESLSKALRDYGRASGRQVIFTEDLVRGRTAPVLEGSYSPDAALARLLEGSGLGSQLSPSGAVMIMSSPGAQKEGAKAAAATQIGEVVVTAQKRVERILDVPVPVTAISAKALIDSNQVRLLDYYASVPGLNVAPTSLQSQQHIDIRGVTSGGGNPTVGIMIDDIPYGSTTGIGGGEVPPDLDPNDLERIEVLRGPQGTLYGAASIGGLIKFVTIDPSTEAFSGAVQAGASGVNHGAEGGYSLRGSVNIPLTDNLAVRASGFARQDPGWISNPVTGADGVNEEHDSGGRLAALWRPSDTISLKLSALYQDVNGNGVSSVDLLPTLHGLEQNYIPGTGAYHRTIQDYSAIWTVKLGTAELTSLTGYGAKAFHDAEDITYLFGPYTMFEFGVPGTPYVNDNQTDKFSQEVRLAVPIGKKLDLLVGGFYTQENTHFEVSILASNPVTGQQVATWSNTFFPSTYEEYAAFADLTYHFTDWFDIQVGGRESHIDQSASEVSDGIAYNTLFLREPVASYVIPSATLNASPFTYLVTPEIHLSPDLMVYARLASGYRAGGINVTLGVPRTYNPDMTQNYELGVKGEFLDRKLSIDASLYYIDWKDIQLGLHSTQNGAGYIGNGGAAKSEGAELTVEARPVTGLTVTGWVAVNDSQLTENLPATSTVVGESGDRLPWSPRFSGYLSVEDRFRLTSSVSGFVEGAFSYVGDRLGSFQATATRSDSPAYTKTDARVGVRYQSWTVSVYANNITDERGVLLNGTDVGPSYAVNYITPRTVGVSVAKSF